MIVLFGLTAFAEPPRPGGLPDEALWFEPGVVVPLMREPGSPTFRNVANERDVELKDYTPTFKKGRLRSVLASFETDRSPATARWSGKSGPFMLWPRQWLQLVVHESTPEGMWIEPKVQNNITTAVIKDFEAAGPGFTFEHEGRTFTLGEIEGDRISATWTGNAPPMTMRLLTSDSLNLFNFENVGVAMHRIDSETWRIELRHRTSSTWVLRPPPPPPPEKSMRQQAADMLLKTTQRISIHKMRKGLPEDLKAVFGDEVPLDFWNNPYVYVTPGPDGRPYDLRSHGADGKPGGDGDDADLGWVEAASL